MAKSKSSGNSSSKSSATSAAKAEPKAAPFPPGTFSWIELGTTDATAAKKFYGELIGWTFTDNPMGEGGVYTMVQLGGKDVGGLYKLDNRPGVPPHWLSYVAVLDASAAAKKAAECGGKILQDAFDVMDAGRMAVLEDPTGAVFAVWQAKNHAGAGVADNRPGTSCWNELQTSNVDRAGKFYTQVFGWRAEFQQMGPMQYTTFWNGEKRAAGMMALPAQAAGAPSHWMVYFAVADCDATVGKARQLGAKVLAPPMDIPDVGRFAVLQDPQGAVFSVIKMSAA